MKIYLITRNDGTNWDESHAFVVKADSEAEARNFAQAQSGDEGSDLTFWTNNDNKFVSCVIIGHAYADNPDVTNALLRGVILRDSLAYLPRRRTRGANAPQTQEDK